MVENTRKMTAKSRNSQNFPCFSKFSIIVFEISQFRNDNSFEKGQTNKLGLQKKEICTL